jgi:glycine/D-amino acid oxidase-like deaminating enzyme
MAPAQDVIVAGLGGMGSTAAHHLAARGARVLGLEKSDPVHGRGSDRTVHGHEVAAIAEYFAERMSTLPGFRLNSATCMYTTIREEHFVIARRPEHPESVVACGFSGTAPSSYPWWGRSPPISR